MIQVHIEKLIFGGQALGRYENKVVLVWNALPGEDVMVEVMKEKRNFIEGVAREIITPSSVRVTPQEGHYLSCSPWQILAPEDECFWKKKVAREVYRKFSKLETENLEIETIHKQTYGYRNKIEYSFTQDENDELSLAFFRRGTKKKQPIPHCTLAKKAMNEIAHYIRDELQKEKIRSHDLKSLIVRANESGQTCAGLFVTSQTFPKLSPNLPENCKGLGVYYSRGEHPASEIDSVLYTFGDVRLSEEIAAVHFEYDIMSFFQVNIPIFIRVLDEMKKHVARNEKVLDFYGGVGSLSLPLGNIVEECTIVDNNLNSIECAARNIKTNSLKNFKTLHCTDDKARSLITKSHTLILDPPREGVHPNVLKTILDTVPQKILYLSCNPCTQARDLALLQEKYSIAFHRLYNFFPKTPHIESFCILEKMP